MIAIFKIPNNRKRRPAAVIAIALLGGLVAWHASLRVGAGPASGVGVDCPPIERPVEQPDAERSTFRVGTFNLAGGRGSDGRRDLSRAAKTLKGLDLVALQEARGWAWDAEDNQVHELGQALGLGGLYAPAESRWYCKQFGNGVLSDVPVEFWQRIPLPRVYDRSYRNVVLLVVEIQGRPIRVLAAHVAQREPREREMQLKTVVGLFLSLEKPVLLLGDLNSRPDDPTLRRLIDKKDVDDPLERLIARPSKDRVDWILTRGLRCTSAGVRNEGASDHPLYWVEIAP